MPGAMVVLNAASTSESTSCPAIPGRYNAVHRAGIRVAILRFGKVWAWNATSCRLSVDGSSPALSSGTTSCGALRPSREFVHDAVVGACLGLASAGCVKVGAYVTTVQRVRDDSARTTLRSTATGFGANRPTGPVTHVTVDWARTSTAHHGFAKRRASIATMRSKSYDRPRTRLGAKAASCIAFTPTVEG